LLSFKISEVLISQNEIQKHEARSNEFKRMLAAVAEVFLFDLAVQPPCEEVIDDATLRKTLHAGVSFGFELAPESGGPFAPMSAGEREELTGGEVTGVGGDNVEKAGFHFRITEGF